MSFKKNQFSCFLLKLLRDSVGYSLHLFGREAVLLGEVHIRLAVDRV